MSQPYIFPDFLTDHWQLLSDEEGEQAVRHRAWRAEQRILERQELQREIAERKGLNWWEVYPITDPFPSSEDDYALVAVSLDTVPNKTFVLGIHRGFSDKTVESILRRAGEIEEGPLTPERLAPLLERATADVFSGW